MGVVTEADVDYGRIYGPFPSVGNIPPSHFIGLIAADERTEQRKLKVSGEGSGSAWLPYIEPARTEEEQNVEAYMKQGNIYYRTLRIIKTGEEFYVWYSKDFAQILDMPDVKRAHTEETVHSCDACGERFRFLYPFIAHVRFRCKRPVCCPIVDGGQPGDDETKHFSADPTNKRCTKRKLDTEENPSPKRKSPPILFEENNNHAVSKVMSLPEKLNEVRDVCSAFRKVEKSQAREHDKSVNTATVSTALVEAGSDVTTYDIDDKDSANNQHIYPNELRTSSKPLDTRFSGGLGMLVSNWMLPTSSGGPAYPRIYRDPHPVVSSSNKVATASQLGSFGSSTCSLPTTNEMLSKQLLMEQLRKAQLPYVQTVNPMVEKLLSTATPTMVQRPVQPISLAQNWCAKCNATFRMTSDLVYHMRSHHKREFDPMKRKREDKLQCNVCKETFKERHHLTRHMTSHA